MEMEDQSMRRIAPPSIQLPNPFACAHFCCKPNPYLDFVEYAIDPLQQRPMATKLFGEPQRKRHKGHEAVEGIVLKNVIPAKCMFDSSSSSGVVDTKISPPEIDNGMPLIFDLDFPAPAQEDDEDENRLSHSLLDLVGWKASIVAKERPNSWERFTKSRPTGVEEIHKVKAYKGSTYINLSWSYS